MVISATLNGFTAYGFSWRPKRCCIFFFAINVHGNRRYSKNGIPDQPDGIFILFQTKMAKSIPHFRLEMLENGTLWNGTYYGLYMGVGGGGGGEGGEGGEKVLFELGSEMVIAGFCFLRLSTKRPTTRHSLVQSFFSALEYQISPPHPYISQALTFPLPSSTSTFSQPFKEKCTSGVVRIGSVIIFHLSKL